MKLVRGSHIVVPRLYDGDHAHILQADDRRVVFVMPFEGAFSLIGTTDVEVGTKEDGKSSRRKLTKRNQSIFAIR